jgi:hypothetical protein
MNHPSVNIYILTKSIPVVLLLSFCDHRHRHRRLALFLSFSDDRYRVHPLAAM